MASVTEPARIYWATGIAVSLVVHAGVVAGTALLASRYAVAARPTEITFSDEASPVAAPVRTEAERVAPAEVVASAAQETVAPALTPEASSAAAAEALQPLGTAPLSAEAVQPAETASAPEVVQPVDALQSPEAEPEALAPESPQPEADADASPEALQPSTPAGTPPESPAETALLLPTDDTLPASGGVEQLSPSAADAADTSPAAEAAESIPAAGQPSSVATVPAIAPEEPQSGAQAAVSAPAETVAALAPDAAARPEALQPETVQPAVPSGTGAAPAASTQSESTAPVPPSAETVTGVAPAAVAPTQPEGTDAASETVVPTQSAPAQAAEPQVETALLVPARPNSSLGTEVDKPSDRYRRIVDFIRGYGGGDCFIALPAMDPAGAVTFQTFGRDKAREDAFRRALLGIEELRAEINSGNVADPQCLALAFARDTRRYPGFSLMIDLDEVEMASGAKLSGSVLNAGGRELHLLLVDDEGLVQSIDRFLTSAEGNDRAFSVPLTLTAGPVVTKQILMAITTDPPLPELADVSQPAELFFRYLAEAISANAADVDLAVEGFVVR